MRNLIKQILREEMSNENGGYVFYHTTDKNIKELIPQIRDDRRKSNYLFFSNEKNNFISGDYIYKVEINFNPNKIFNVFDSVNEYGLTYTLGNHIDEVKKLLTDNLDYFMDAWIDMGVDSPKEVIEYYVDEGGDEDDKVGLLYYFLTEWNDSWAILETNKFLNFIESKGYDGFVTREEGFINLALRKFNSIKIIDKEDTI